jgi:POT family proton-dependent oligopeptide transporter
MRSTVQGIALFTSAVSSALGQALVGLSEDPLLVWNYGSVAVVAMIGAVGFWFTFQKADKEEDRLNNLAKSTFIGRAEVHEEGQVGHVETVHEKNDKEYKI